MTKITYTSADIDLDAFHAAFDSALGALRETLGREYTNWIGGTAVAGNGRPLVDVTPIDTRRVLGKFAAARTTDVDRAVQVRTRRSGAGRARRGGSAWRRSRVRRR